MDTQPTNGNLAAVPDAAAAPESPSTAATAASTSDRSRPKKILPTNRMAFPKQQETLRGWAIAGAEGKVATNHQVAEIVGLKADTISLTNAFFADVKFLNKVENGYTPTDATLAFNQAHAWAPETAAHKLAPALKETWFGKAVLPMVALRTITEDEALIKLGEAASAGPSYRPQLSLLLDWLDAAGLIVRDGGQVKAGTPGAPVAAATPAPEKPEQPAAPSPTQGGHVPGTKATGVATGFAQTPEGQLQFSVNFRVTMSELAGWEPARITAFFAGVAQVLAAKAEVEKEASSG